MQSNKGRTSKCKYLTVVTIFPVLFFLTSPVTASAGQNYPVIGFEGRFVPVIFSQKVFYPNISGRTKRIGLELGGNSIRFKLDDSFTINSRNYNATAFISQKTSLGMGCVSLKSEKSSIEKERLFNCKRQKVVSLGSTKY